MFVSYSRSCHNVPFCFMGVYFQSNMVLLITGKVSILGYRIPECISFNKMCQASAFFILPLHGQFSVTVVRISIMSFLMMTNVILLLSDKEFFFASCWI